MIFDWVKRAMPYDRPGRLTANEAYALTAFLLFRTRSSRKRMSWTPRACQRSRCRTRTCTKSRNHGNLGRHGDSRTRSRSDVRSAASRVRRQGVLNELDQAAAWRLPGHDVKDHRSRPDQAQDVGPARFHPLRVKKRVVRNTNAGVPGSHHVRSARVLPAFIRACALLTACGWGTNLAAQEHLHTPGVSGMPQGVPYFCAPVTTTSVATGPWSSPNTWSTKKVPSATTRSPSIRATL